MDSIPHKLHWCSQVELVRLLGPLCIDRVDAPRGSRRRTLLRMACEAGRTDVAAILVDELGKGLAQSCEIARPSTNWRFCYLSPFLAFEA